MNKKFLIKINFYDLECKLVTKKQYKWVLISYPRIQKYLTESDIYVLKIQWGPGKIVHDLNGSSMTYKSFCLFLCIWHQSRIIFPEYQTFFWSILCSLGSCDHIQWFQWLLYKHLCASVGWQWSWCKDSSQGHTLQLC